MTPEPQERSFSTGNDIRVYVSEVHSARGLDIVAGVVHPRFPGWRFRLTFGPGGALVEFSVASEKPPITPTMAAGMAELRGVPRGHGSDAAPVTARFLKKVPLGELEQAARAGLRTWPGMGDSHWSEVFSEVKRPGRAGRDHRGYAEVARQYVAKLATGSRSPVKELAGDLDYSESQLRSILNAARGRGLLTRAEAGKAGGELTQKALEILRQDEGGK